MAVMPYYALFIQSCQEYLGKTYIGEEAAAVERAFALTQHSYGLGLITAKLDETTRSTIAMPVRAMNIDRILAKRMFL